MATVTSYENAPLYISLDYVVKLNDLTMKLNSLFSVITQNDNLRMYLIIH